MKTEEKTVTVYVSNDGKEHLTESDCKKQDAYLKEINNIQYFSVRHGIDKTETGNYYSKTLVAIGSNSCYLRPEDVLLNWGIKTFGNFLECSVQGYGYQRTFEFSKITADDWNECKSYCVYGGWGTHIPKKVFISEKEIEGFPEPYNIKTEWGIK